MNKHEHCAIDCGRNLYPFEEDRAKGAGYDRVIEISYCVAAMIALPPRTMFW